MSQCFNNATSPVHAIPTQAQSIADPLHLKDESSGERDGGMEDEAENEAEGGRQKEEHM